MGIVYNKHLLADARDLRMIMPGDYDTATRIMDLKKADTYESLYVDKAAAHLASMIGEKGWDLPNINAHFSFIPGKHPVHILTRLEGTEPGKKWVIEFNRSEFTDGKNIIPSKPSRLVIPKREMRFGEKDPKNGARYLDKNEPQYFHYIGDDWLQDEDEFIACKKPGNKHDRLNLLYLCYHQKNPKIKFYKFTNDGKREGERRKGKRDPVGFPIEPLHRRFAQFFLDRARELKSLPDHEKGPYTAWLAHARTEKIPAPTNMPVLYVCRKKPKHSPDEPYSLSMENGQKLYLGPGKEKLSSIASQPVHFAFNKMPYEGAMNHFSANPILASSEIIKVTLENANDIFVINGEEAEKQRRDFLEKLEKYRRYELSSDNWEIILHETAKTVVPLKDYQNNFEEAVFLVARPLAASEAVDITADVRQRKKGQKNFVLRPEAFT